LFTQKSSGQKKIIIFWLKKLEIMQTQVIVARCSSMYIGSGVKRELGLFCCVALFSELKLRNRRFLVGVCLFSRAFSGGLMAKIFAVEVELMEDV
jgi:hypothetical protein